MTAFVAFIRSPLTWIVAAVIGTAAVIGWTFHKGEKAASAEITSAVEKTTVDAIERAQRDKEKADEKVRSDPPDRVIDSTR